MQLIDTHAHLDEQSFDVDRDDVVARALQAGLLNVVTVGVTLESSRRSVELAGQYPAVFAAVGIHPNYSSQAQPDDFAAIEQLTVHGKVVAVGETGLDKYWDFAPLDVQTDYFRRHIELSQHIGKPFIVHCRDSESETLAALQSAAKGGKLNGVMHSFSGDSALASACLELGMHISFAGMVTYKRNDELRQVAKEVPLDRLLVETDSPYLSPVPLRGKRNEPANVVHTARCLAEVKGISLGELADVTTRNARRFFSLP